MKIKRIILNGYKRFKKLTIDLGDNPKRIVALVGPNGCGKSSVFDGMLYLTQAYGTSPGVRTGNKDYNYHSLLKDKGYNFQNVNIAFTTGDYSKVKQEKDKTGKTKTIFSFRSPYRYNSNLKVKETKAISELSNNDYGAALSSDLDDKIVNNYKRLNAYYISYMNRTDSRPSEAKKHIIGELNKSLQACLDLEITNIGDIQSDKGTLYFTKSDYSGSEFEFNVLSAGEKEVVDILLDLYLRKEDYNDSIFLIDEPELHINTSIQRKLLIEINRLIGEECQIWVATHSIGFLRALQEELKDDCQIIEFKADTPWATIEQTLTPVEKTRRDWSNIFNIALDDLTALVSPKRIIYCEGRDKPKAGGVEKGFDAQVYNNIFSSKYPETIFVSSGGNTELDQRSNIAIAILTKVFPTIEIWVCKDRDMASGTMNTEADRLEYLRLNGDNHRVINRWEVENYLFDKEVLKAYCVDNNKTFDEAKYDSVFTDIVNNNLKDSVSVIKACCGITGSINSEIFKIELSKYITESMHVFKELDECIFERK